MILSWPETKRRIAVPAADGLYFPAFTGTETDAELRELVLQMARNCRQKYSHPICQFRMLLGLSFPAMQNLLNNMERSALLDMLNEECFCRQTHHGQNCQTGGTQATADVEPAGLPIK